MLIQTGKFGKIIFTEDEIEPLLKIERIPHYENNQIFYTLIADLDQDKNIIRLYLEAKILASMPHFMLWNFKIDSVDEKLLSRVSLGSIELFNMEDENKFNTNILKSILNTFSDPNKHFDINKLKDILRLEEKNELKISRQIYDSYFKSNSTFINKASLKLSKNPPKNYLN